MLLVAVGITMKAYTGWRGERFSVINHFVSELGSKVSIRAPLFNAALTVASILFIPLAVGLTGRFRGWQRFVFGLLVFAVVASIGLLGFFPTSRIKGHLALAFVFFLSALGLFLFTAMVTLFSRQPILPKWIALVSFLAATPFGILGVVPRDRLWTMITDHTHFVRPDFWPLAIVEWMCFFMITVWILSMAAMLVSSVPVYEDRLRHTNI